MERVLRANISRGGIQTDSMIKAHFWLDAGSFLAHFRSITILYPDWKIRHQLSERLQSLGIMEAQLRTPTLLKPLNTIVVRCTGGFQGVPEGGGLYGEVSRTGRNRFYKPDL